MFNMFKRPDGHETAITIYGSYSPFQLFFARYYRALKARLHV